MQLLLDFNVFNKFYVIFYEFLTVSHFLIYRTI